jgi:hypothetical protein
VEDTIEIGMSLYEVVPFEPVSPREMHLSVGDELGTMAGVALVGTLLGSIGEAKNELLGTLLGSDILELGPTLGSFDGPTLGETVGDV